MMMPRNKVLILGAKGMLGSGINHVLSQVDNLEVIGTARKLSKKELNVTNLILLEDALNKMELHSLLRSLRPNVIVNCVGIIKQKQKN